MMGSDLMTAMMPAVATAPARASRRAASSGPPATRRTIPPVARLPLEYPTARVGDDVDDLVPGVIRSDPPITLRMLLDHTSGLFNLDEGDPVADTAKLTDPTLIAEVAALTEGTEAGQPVVASDRLLLALAEAAIERGDAAWTLEVRVSAKGAQELYRRFGFTPAGVRARYYENTEDAIVMWCQDIQTDDYRTLLGSIRAEMRR